MRFGFQTILWDLRDDLREALPITRDAGFTGVEVAQPPDVLGSLDEFVARLDKHELQLIGLDGGTLEQRMNYMRPDFEHRGERPYLYTDVWHEEECKRAISSGYRLALHPHYPERATRLERVWDLLAEHRELYWLPDTGHLYVSWANIHEALTRNPARLAAVHIKDWTSIFGRSTTGQQKVSSSQVKGRSSRRSIFGKHWTKQVRREVGGRRSRLCPIQPLS